MTINNNNYNNEDSNSTTGCTKQYIKTVAMNNTLVNVYFDSVGQTYYINFACNGQVREMTCGSYNSDYMDMIEYEFGKPEVDCEHYEKHEKLGKYSECSYRRKGYCDRCSHFDPRETLYQELLSMGVVDRKGNVVEKYSDILTTK